MKSIKTSFKLSVIPLLSVSIQPSYVSAQNDVLNRLSDDEAFSIEEIVVTAERRSQSMQEVGIALSVFDESSLDNRSLSRIEDLAFSIPNFHFVQPADARAAQVSIRGITGDTRFPGQDAAVGMFLDGAYVSGAIGSNIDLVEIERIEVLRGPQGTLYGRNTAAGAINIISKQPPIEASSKIAIEFGNYGHMKVQGSFGGALTDGLEGQVSIARHTRDGYEENTFLSQDLNTAESDSVRAALNWHPNEELQARLIFDYMKEDRVPGMPDATPDDRKDELNVTMFEQREVGGVNLTIDYALHDHNLTSITAYRGYEYKRRGDDDGTKYDAIENQVDEKNWQLSEEFRIASPVGETFDWVAGAYFLRSNLDYDLRQKIDYVGLTDVLTDGFGATTCPFIFGPLCNSPFNVDNRINVETTAAALFSQMTFHVLENVDAVVGLRYSYEEKDISVRQLAAVPGTMDALDTKEALIDKALTPKLALNYQINDDFLLYGSIARGSKSAGYNTTPLNAANLAQFEFDSELSTNYEIGIKSEFLDNRLQINVTGFYIDYEDIQVLKASVTPIGVMNSLANAANATSLGIEADITGLLTQNWQLSASLGLNEAEFDSYEGCTLNPQTGGQVDCSGNSLPSAPKRTASLSTVYNGTLSGLDMDYVLFGEWAYRGETYYDVFNSDFATQSGYSIINASVALMDSDGDWKLTLWGKNLSGEDYATLAIPPTIEPSAGITYGAPRTYGLKVELNF